MNKLKGFPDNYGENCCYMYKLRGFPLMTIMVKLWNVYLSLKFFYHTQVSNSGERSQGWVPVWWFGARGMSVLIYNVLGGIVAIRSPLLYTLEIPIRIVDKGTSPNVINPSSLHFCVLFFGLHKTLFPFSLQRKRN